MSGSIWSLMLVAQSEDRVAAVDDDAVAGVKRDGGVSKVRGDRAKLVRVGPAADRSARDRVAFEGRLLAAGIEQVRVGPARQECVDPDAVLGELNGEGTSEREERSLRGGVRLPARRALDSGDRRDGDECTAFTAIDEVSRAGAQSQKCA